MYFTYVLKSKIDGNLYYGFTQSIEQRLIQHNNGEVRSTRKRAPLELIYFEVSSSLIEARKKERYFKSGFGRKYIQNKIKTALSSNG